MRTLRVRPPDGAECLNPDNGNRPLDRAGEVVPVTTYWLRRIADGDCVEVPDPPATPAAKGPKPPAKT